MVFNQNTNLEQVKKKDPETYDKLLVEATAVVTEKVETERVAKVEADKVDPEVTALKKENKELKEQLDTKANNDSITAYGAKLETVELAAECVTKCMSFNDSLIAMVDESLKHKENVIESFEESASDIAGGGSTDNEEDGEPKTFSEAMAIVKKRDKCTAMEAKETAVKEFPDLVGVHPESEEDK